MRLTAVATSLLCCGVALALSGTLLDPDGKPVTGGRACYLVAGVEQLCVEADDKGFFDLPDSRVDTIRVRGQNLIDVVRGRLYITTRQQQSGKLDT